MKPAPAKFAQLLTEAIHHIRLREGKSVEIVQDEIGYALGREGSSPLRYWRKGHIPAAAADVRQLAQILLQRGQFSASWLEAFLRSSGYSELLAELSPPAPPSPPAVLPLTPFVVGPPITHPAAFFGREKEIRRIFALFSRFPLQNVALIGPYRSGKTSLLHYLKNITRTPAAELRPGQKGDWLPHPADYQWLFIDFQDPRLRQKQFLLPYILQQLGFTVPTSCTLPHFVTALSEQLTQPTVILLDEIGAALAAPDLDLDFWWALRSLGTNLTQGKLAFVLTAHELPSKLAQEAHKPSPFFNIFGHTHFLTPFTEPEALAFLESSPEPFPAEDMAWMMAQTQRWPCLLAIFAYAKLCAVQEKEFSDQWRTEAWQQAQPFLHLLTN